MVDIDPEVAAQVMRETAGLRRGELPGAVGFADRFLGPGRVLLVDPREVWGDGEATADGYVLVRADLPYEDREFTIYHECCEIWIARRGMRIEYRAKEAACDATAGALQAPPAIFAVAVRELGHDAFAELAAGFRATQTAMALRLGEVMGPPVRVERPGLTRTRGRAHDWSRSACVKRVALTDAVDRAAFIAR